jgi:hypothetical protein
MIRATKGKPHTMLAGIGAFQNFRANSLRLLVLAKGGEPLAPDELKELSLMVRGGGGVPDTIRIQAAWAYLKQTSQLPFAIAKATGAKP